MSRRLDVSDLETGVLSIRSVGEKNFEVRIGDAVVGQIMARKRSFGRIVWFWSLSGPHIPETMAMAGTNAQTLEGAKQAIKRTFEAWMYSVTGRNRDIAWAKSTNPD